MKSMRSIFAAAICSAIFASLSAPAAAGGLRHAVPERALSSSSTGGGGSTPTTSGGSSGGSTPTYPSPSPHGSSSSSGTSGSPTTGGGGGSTTSTGTSSYPSPTPGGGSTTSTGTSSYPSPTPGGGSTTSTSTHASPIPSPGGSTTSTGTHASPHPSPGGSTTSHHSDDHYGPSGGGYGMDVSQPVSQSTWSCLKQQGNDYAIVRAWHSYGGFDSNAPSTLDAASAAGLSTSIYMFPCAGKSASAQVQSMLSQLGGGFDTAWLDIETNPSGGCGWSGDQSTNCAFIKEALTALQEGAGSVGAYVSPFMWSSIAGSGCTAGSDLGAQLWYPTYDGSDNCDDFTPFGGWGSALMKQYTAGYSACGLGGQDRNVKC